MLRPIPLCLFPALLILAATSRLLADQSPPPSAWDNAALGLLKEAHASFAKQPAEDREARFGEAVTLINLQPKTDANLDRAAALFTAIAASNAADHLGISSRYFLARIPQVHRVTPDVSAALVIFRELATLDSPHPLAQHAVVQLALIELFEPGIPPDEIRTRFERLSTRGVSLNEPSAIRDFNLVMGDAALRFKLGDAIALDHLLAGERAGIARAGTRRDTWIRIAELARRTGRTDIATSYYNLFLENFPRDARRLMVKERLAALTSTSDAAPRQVVEAAR